MKNNKLVYYSLYIVNLDYQKHDGYWVCSHKEEVEVPYDPHTENEKNLHDKAAKIALSKYDYKFAKVNSVTYC
jgi:hypothetical protein